MLMTNARNNNLFENIFVVGTCVGVVLGASAGMEQASRIKTNNSAEAFFNQLKGGVVGAAEGGLVGGPLAVGAVMTGAVTVGVGVVEVGAAAVGIGAAAVGIVALGTMGVAIMVAPLALPIIVASAVLDVL